MAAMLQYLLNASAIWLISLVVFEILLKKENNHGYNRFYLVFTFLLGILLPLRLIIENLHASLNSFYMIDPKWWRWIGIIYFAGVVITFLLLIVDIIKLIIFYRQGKKTKTDGWVVVETGREHPPFSYLDILFVSGKEQYSNDEWEMILNHERRHSVLLHLIDMLLTQICRIAFWFHPLVHIYHTRLLLVHEYQADYASSKQAEKYGRFLVEQSVLKAAPSFSHSFNRSPIKNRIFMLTKNAKPRTGISNLKLLAIIPITITFITFFSKNSFSIEPPGEIWKKQVIRMIDFNEPEDTVMRHLRQPEPDSTLLEIMALSINAGKLTAYSSFDTRFTEKITKEDFKKMMSADPDTALLTDPVTGKEIVKVIKRDIDYSKVTKYRILEEWTYNQRTRKTEIEVIGIAPMLDIYGMDGTFRGRKPFFWVRYNDIQSLLARYELYHPHNTLASHIWEDNFKSPEKQ